VIRTAARLEADFPKPKSGESGAGPLAQLLANGLRVLKFTVISVEDVQYGHVVNVRSGEYDYEIMTAFDFEDGKTWEVCCPPVLGSLARLRGKSEEKELTAVVRAIASVLRAERSLRNVRWYATPDDLSDPSAGP
jgi:hypothetical protein